MQRRTTKVLIAAVAAVVVALSLGTAQAHIVRSPSAITLKIDDIDPATSQYSGKVGALQPPLRRCAIGRLVTITSGAGLQVQTVTNLNGDYAVNGPKQAQGTDVTATVGRKVLRKNRKHRHICLPANKSHKAPK